MKANLGVAFPYVAVSTETAQTKLYYQLSRIDWRLSQLSWFAGLSTKWRMFAPPPMSNWYYSVWSINSRGEQNWVPLYGQGERNFFQRNFFDFREVKYHLNIYNKPEALSKLAAHLCLNLRAANQDIQAIRITLVSRQTLPPDDDNYQTGFFADEIVSEFGVYPCS